MPVYDYRCGDCGLQWEVREAWDARTAECPQCGAGRPTRVFPTPAVKSDGTLFKGNAAQRQYDEDPGGMALRRRVAEASGASVSGKVYREELAAHPNDPEAWVPVSEARSYIKRLLTKRGWGSEDMGVAVRPQEAKPTPPLAPDIVDAIVAEKIEQNPALALKPRRELQEEVIEKHTPHWRRPGAKARPKKKRGIVT